MKQAIRKSNFILIFLIFISQAAIAQFSVDAQLRARGEVRDGYQKINPEDASPAVLVSQRTRLAFTYEMPRLKLKIVPQDVRLWGDQAKLSATGVGDNPSLDLYEAYAELRISELLSISAGRQELIYDNGRMLGNRNWNQNGISYDALVLKYRRDGWKIDAGASWNTLSEASYGNLYPKARIKSLNYLWINKKVSEKLNLSFLHISSGYTKTDTTDPINFRHTSGFYGNYSGEALNFMGNAYYQYGKNRDGNKLNAMLIEAEISLKTGKLTPGAGISYLSGNDKTPGPDETDKLFDPLYGNRHGFNGAMDYFTNYPVQTRQGGLADYYLWLDYKFSKKVSVRNTVHFFNLAMTNPGTPDDKALGFENDLILKYRFSEWGNLESGYIFFNPTETLKEIQQTNSDNFNQFFYIQLTLTPNLFKQTNSPLK
ncbi:alginate export family protein [Lentimicrobium sp.]|uniref:alginate export family protein n=1 Tax=Lentimicrobium sp. TaxID=2034841 RepID=UPI002C0509F6|nr:alginate export family protein [Lentimicrobium sp.]HPJ61657.1 alginate export family protein [Lentimicrobium sp.]